MNPQEMQDPNMEQQEQEIPSDPVSLAKQIQAIEKEMKDGVHFIQQVLTVLISNKLTLDKIKSITKENLKNISNGNK